MRPPVPSGDPSSLGGLGFSIYSLAADFLGFAVFDLMEENYITHLNYDVYMHGLLSGVSHNRATLLKKSV